MKGGGESPSSGKYRYPCHGHVTHPSMILPSPSGPFWCRQTFEIADIFPSYLKIATRSPLRETTVAHFSGISVSAQAFTNPSAAGPSVFQSTLASRRAAATCSVMTVNSPTPVPTAKSGLVSNCSRPKVVARRCHKKKNHESEKAQLLKGEIREASEILIRSQQTDERVLVTETVELSDCGHAVDCSQQKGQNAEMPPVIK